MSNASSQQSDQELVIKQFLASRGLTEEEFLRRFKHPLVHLLEQHTHLNNDETELWIPPELIPLIEKELLARVNNTDLDFFNAYKQLLDMSLGLAKGFPKSKVPFEFLAMLNTVAGKVTPVFAAMDVKATENKIHELGDKFRNFAGNVGDAAERVPDDGQRLDLKEILRKKGVKV